jgi:hypothetical protein
MEGILQRGLLSTSELLDLFGVAGAARNAIEIARRPNTIPIDAPRYGTAYIRDQRPLSEPRIAASLRGATVPEFLRFINGQVFFWSTQGRLIGMNEARAYRGSAQLVFVVKTESLVNAHLRRIRLSPMNSGCTTPFAHPRSIEMFRPIADFDRPTVVELTVERSVPDIWDHVERLEIWQDGERVRRLNRPYDGSLARRLA